MGLRVHPTGKACLAATLLFADRADTQFAGVDLRVHPTGKACLAATLLFADRADTQVHPYEKRVFLWMWVAQGERGGLIVGEELRGCRL